MLLLYTGLAIVLVVLGAGGEVGRLLDARLHRVRLLFAGVGVHLLVSHWRPTGGLGRAVGFLLVLTSLALVMRFVVANLALTNMSIVLVGLGLNALVVLVNGGMPVVLPASASEAERAEYEHSLTHHLQREDDHLTVLADHLRLPGPTDTPISYGDLVLAFGLVGVGYRLATDRRGAHAARPNAAPMIEVPADEPLFPDPEPITVIPAPAPAFEPVMAFLAGVAGASAGPGPHDLTAVAEFVAGVDGASAGLAPHDLEAVAAFVAGADAATPAAELPVSTAEVTLAADEPAELAVPDAGTAEPTAEEWEPARDPEPAIERPVVGWPEVEWSLLEATAAALEATADEEESAPAAAELEPADEESEPIEALLVDLDDDIVIDLRDEPGPAAPAPAITPRPEVTLADEPVDEPHEPDEPALVPVGAAAEGPDAETGSGSDDPIAAAVRAVWVRARRHRRLPRPIRPGRIGLHLFAPVPLDPEELLLPWWGEPDPTLAELDDPAFDEPPARSGRPGPWRA